MSSGSRLMPLSSFKPERMSEVRGSGAGSGWAVTRVHNLKWVWMLFKIIRKKFALYSQCVHFLLFSNWVFPHYCTWRRQKNTWFDYGMFLTESSYGEDALTLFQTVTLLMFSLAGRLSWLSVGQTWEERPFTLLLNIEAQEGSWIKCRVVSGSTPNFLCKLVKASFLWTLV